MNDLIPDGEPEDEDGAEESEDPDEAADAVADIEETISDHIDYEFNEWSGQSMSLLDSMLGAEGIAHTWQGTTLLVSIDDEQAVDSLIDVVNQTASQGLDVDRARLVYEVGAWSAAMQTSLAETLEVGDIPFEWDENGDLVIYEDDEERVEEILDAMPDPDDPERADTEGIDVQDVLSHLWEATGTLARKPADPEAVLAAIENAEQIEQIGLPFGFEASVWRDIVGKTLALRAALDSDNPDDQLSDDDLMEGCSQLHDQLRHYV